MDYSRLHQILYRHWWLTFFLMGVSFVLFGLFSLNLLHALGANFDFLLSDRKSTRLNSSHIQKSRMPSSA